MQNQSSSRISVMYTDRMDPQLMNLDEQWRIVGERDARYDGKLYYGVSSTGIYCVPSCPSRRPKSEHVRFFESAEAAEKAGFRPCLRCKPNAPHIAVAVVSAVTDYIDRHPDETVTLERLGEITGVSPFHLQRTFKKATGITPRAYMDSKRAARFAGALKNAPSVTDAIYDAGYQSASRAYERSPSNLGMNPSQKRRRGEGARIRFAIAPTEFGHLLVAATERGVCAVRLGDSPEQLAAEFGQDFGAAEVMRDESLASVIDQILVLIGNNAPHPQIPIDISATAFQRRVWEYLQQIPRGSTRSYSQVAADIGKPRAVRAVARACATNPVALVIPCHRVVASDGKLTGYRWGVDRKQRLLQKELDPQV